MSRELWSQWGEPTWAIDERNELYTDPKTGMLFADAKQGTSDLLAAVRSFVR